MHFRITRQAERDIIRIYERGHAAFGAIHAERYHANLIAVFTLLADNPLMARERISGTRAVRLHPYEAHLIIYALRDDHVLIVRVLHGRQDWQRHL